MHPHISGKPAWKLTGTLSQVALYRMQQPLLCQAALSGGLGLHQQELRGEQKTTLYVTRTHLLGQACSSTSRVGVTKHTPMKVVSSSQAVPYNGLPNPQPSSLLRDTRLHTWHSLYRLGLQQSSSH